MRACGRCGGTVESEFRFCPWCAAPQRLKLVEFFAAHDGIDPGKALRVSSYLDGGHEGRHVRFSVWDERGRVEAAVSLGEGEARRLAAFVEEASPVRLDEDDQTQPLRVTPL